MSIEVSALKKRYGRFSTELEFSIADGETLVLAGPSGCGKTTALRMVAGLVAPDSGRITLDGRDVCGVPAWKRGIGVVFQDLALFPHLTVSGNVSYGPFVRGAPKGERERVVAANLAMTRLEGYERRRVDTLSGGERQRTAIARALAASPRALLMDEPFSSLDAPLRRTLRAEFRRLRERSDYPCLFVTHDREEAANLADRLAIMDGGKIIEIGPPRELFRSPRTAFAARFLGSGTVLRADSVGMENGKERARSAIGVTSLVPQKNASGTKRTILIPRGALRVVSPDAEEARCRATLRSSLFSGDRVSLSVELADGTVLDLDVPVDFGPYPDGSIVGLVVEEALLRFVEDDPD